MSELPKEGEIVIIMGYPGSGKSTACQQFPKHQRLNRDDANCSMKVLHQQLDKLLGQGKKHFVLDNTYTTRAHRQELLGVAARHKVPVRCIRMTTSIEDCQVNMVQRMFERFGRLLMPEEIKASDDPGIYPPAALFSFRKKYEAPELSEGFALLEEFPFERKHRPDYTGKALFLDYDGTLRETISGAKYPVDPNDQRILANRAAVLRRYQAEGYLLFGVSNQGDVASGKLTVEQVEAGLRRTNELLGLEIKAVYCPHNPAPTSCYCRKPMPGLGVAFIELHKLDRAQVIMVGDRTTDKTFAKRCGVRFEKAEEFFA